MNIPHRGRKKLAIRHERANAQKFGGFERAEHAAILIATGEAKRNL